VTPFDQVDRVDEAKAEFLAGLKAVRSAGETGQDLLYDYIEPMHEAAVRYFVQVDRMIVESTASEAPSPEFRSLSLARDSCQALDTYLRYRDALSSVLSRQSSEDLAKRYPPNAKSLASMQAAVGVMLPDEMRRLRREFAERGLPTNGFEDRKLASALRRAWSPSRPTADAPTVLWLSANPSDTVNIGVATELRRVQEGLPSDGSVNFQAVGATRVEDFIEQFNVHRPRIAHFSGHGQRDGIIVVGEDGHEKLTTEELVELIGEAEQRLALMVLSACSTADDAEALTKVVDASVGMRGAIDTEAARAFNVRFYRSLVAQRVQLERAFSQTITLLGRTAHREESAKIEIFYAHESAKNFRLLD